MIDRVRDLGLVLLGVGMLASVGVALAGVGDPMARVAAAPVVPPAIDIAPIVRLAPFGRPLAARVATTAALELRGVLLARPLAASTALIAPAGGKPVAYAIGDALPGGGILDSVEFDLVVLRIDGRLETLAFPAVRRIAESATAEAARIDPPAAPVAAPDDPPFVGDPEITAQSGR